MQILLVGYGKMGRMVESLAGEYGCDGRGRDRSAVANRPGWAGRRSLARRRCRDRLLVARLRSSGTCPFWRSAASASSSARPAGRRTRRRFGRPWPRRSAGIVAAPNFSTGVLLFEAIVARAAALLGAQREFGAWLHEAHHVDEEGRAVRDGAGAEEDDGGGRVPASDRRVVHARGVHSRDAHGRIRRSGRDDYADAHGPRSHGVRPRRARRGDMGARQTRMVHDARCARAFSVSRAGL